MLLKCCTQYASNMGNSAVATGLEKISFHSSLKERQAKECSNYCTVVLISYASKVMLKILQARLQQYMNGEIPDIQAEFRKGRWTRDQIANILWIIEKARESPSPSKKIYFQFIDYTTAFDCVDHNKVCKILKEMGIPDHLTWLLKKKLQARQEATVRIRHEKTVWFNIGIVVQGCILSPCLFNFYAEYIMKNSGLDESQLESRLPGEISITSGMQMTPPLWQKAESN